MGMNLNWYRMLYIPYDGECGMKVAEVFFQAPDDLMALAVAHTGVGGSCGEFTKDSWEEFLGFLFDEYGSSQPTKELLIHSIQQDVDPTGNDILVYLQNETGCEVVFKDTDRFESRSITSINF